MLGELARLERVVPRMSAAQALAVLRRLCNETLFQPEAIDAPVQVLGILESDGLEFDHLWVSGLTDEAWPLAARPNPFLPVALQKKAGIPEASADSALALDRRITEGWKQAAGEVVFSHFTREEDRDVLPSPLVADVPVAELDAVAPKLLVDDGELVTFPDVLNEIDVPFEYAGHVHDEAIRQIRRGPRLEE